MKLKELSEQVGALKKEIRTYLDSEGRKAVADKENDPKLKELEARFSTLQADFDAEIRQVAREGSKPPQLSDTEKRDVDKFSFKRVLQYLRRGGANGGAVLDGVEAEMIAEGLREANEAGISFSGVMVPTMVLRRRELRDMTATTGTTTQYGGKAIQTEVRGLLDAFFDKLVVVRGGATVLNDLRGNLSFPRFVAGTAGTHKLETVALDETNPTVTASTLTPKRLGEWVDVSDQLLLQGEPAIKTIIERNLVNQIRAVAEKSYFEGVHSTTSPEGIFGATGIGSVLGGTNGAAPTYTHLVGIPGEIYSDNADVGNCHWFTNTAVRAKLMLTQQFSSTNGRTAWDALLADDPNPLITNAIGRTHTKGSSGAVCSYLGYGDMSGLVIGFWGGMGIEMVRDATLATTGMNRIVVSLFHDSVVPRPEMFSAMLDVTTT